MTLRALFSLQHLLEIRLRFAQISIDGRRGSKLTSTTAHLSDKSFLSTQNLLQDFIFPECRNVSASFGSIPAASAVHCFNFSSFLLFSVFNLISFSHSLPSWPSIDVDVVGGGVG